MRIGVNARFLLPGKLEGIGWYSFQILDRMVHQYPEHEYIFFYDRPMRPFLISHPSVKNVVLFPPARHPLLWYWWFEYSIPAAVKKYQLDCLFHADGYCSLRSNIPQLMVVHDLAYLHFPEQVPWLVRKYYQYFVPRQLSKANHLFAVSEATKLDMIQHFPDAESKTSIAYNGVRNYFKPLEEAEQLQVRNDYSDGCPYFLFVGAIHPRKNVSGLIRAFNLFKEKTNSEFKLVLVGRKAWDFQNFEQAFQHSPYQKEIIVLDYIAGDQLAKITASAFALVLPSFLEGFGVPVLEALYCNIPVMVSRTFSLPEVAGPGAYLFDPENIEEIADQLVFATRDEKRSERISLGSLHRQSFDWQKSMEAVHNQIVKTTSSR